MGKLKNETPEQRAKRLAYNREWNRVHKDDESKKRKDRYNKWQKDVQISEYRMQRLEVLDRMGGKCIFCGEEDEPVLTIDHVMNDGATERRNFRNVYFRLRNELSIPMDRYQILCLSCNHKKRIFGDDPSKWPIYRTVKEQLEFVKASIMTMEESRRAFRDGQAKETDTSGRLEEIILGNGAVDDGDIFLQPETTGD